MPLFSSKSFVRRVFLAALISVALFCLVGWQTTPSTLDDAGLKQMITGLAYEIKNKDESTFDIDVATPGLKIPTRLFLSKSKSKLWFSVLVMEKERADALTADQMRKLLEANLNSGPAHFMLEKGGLKMKMAIDNRDITPLVLRTEIDYFTARVAETKDLWLKS